MLKNSCVFLLLILLTACTGQEQIDHKIFKKFYAVPRFKTDKKSKAVFLISDNNCSTCNQMFSDFAVQKIDNKDIVYIISADQNKINIAGFTDNKRDNVFIDTDKALYNDDDIKSSIVFLLHENKVDTMLQINTREIEQQLSFIRIRL